MKIVFKADLLVNFFISQKQYFVNPSWSLARSQVANHCGYLRSVRWELTCNNIKQQWSLYMVTERVRNNKFVLKLHSDAEVCKQRISYKELVFYLFIIKWEAQGAWMILYNWWKGRRNKGMYPTTNSYDLIVQKTFQGQLVVLSIRLNL